MWTVVAGSGAGELSGLRGEGSFQASSGAKASFNLVYQLD
jgi:hypothetical protein